ncbi:uncharacterized protein LOC124275617 isoform X2 [Haliotis rubra]|uniref:uncharacterized protein LOC124275617 isoform X2 n=1 Tax=Haliotis rubra TaxID=36100 RepID=UPI001EE53298|nr:uncharacterized protein LOC124275617 isoform X2 [Haliotis rubra]
MVLWYIYLAAILGFVAVSGLPAKHGQSGQSEGDALLDQMYDISLKEQNNELNPHNQRHDVVPDDPKLEAEPEKLRHKGQLHDVKTKGQRLEDPKDKGQDVDSRYRSLHMDPRDRNDAGPKEGSPTSLENIRLVDPDPLYVNDEPNDQWYDIKIKNQRPDSDPQQQRSATDPRPQEQEQELRPDADAHPQELRPDTDPNAQVREPRPDADPNAQVREPRPDADPNAQVREPRPDADPNAQVREPRPDADPNAQVREPRPDADPNAQVREPRPDADPNAQVREPRPDADPNAQVREPRPDADPNAQVREPRPDADPNAQVREPRPNADPDAQVREPRPNAAPDAQEREPRPNAAPDAQEQGRELRPNADHRGRMSTFLDNTLVASDTFVNVEPRNPNYDIKIVDQSPDADPHLQEQRPEANPHPQEQRQRPNADPKEPVQTFLGKTLVAGDTYVNVEPYDPNYDIKIVDQSPDADPAEQKPYTIEGSSTSLDNTLVAGDMVVNVEPQDPRYDVNIKDQWLDADPVDQQYIAPKDGNSIPLHNTLFAGATLYIDIKPKEQSYDVMPKDQTHDVNSEDQLYHVNPEDQMYEVNTDEDRNDDTGPSEDDWQNPFHAENPEEPNDAIHSAPLFTVYGQVEADIEMHPESNGSALVSPQEFEPPRMRNPRPLSMLLKKMLLAAIPPGQQGMARSDPPSRGSSDDPKNVPSASTKQAFFDMNIKAMEPQSTSDEPKLRKLSEILVGIKRRLDDGREESKNRRVFTHLLTYTSIAVVIFVVLSFLTMMTLLCWSVQHL